MCFEVESNCDYFFELETAENRDRRKMIRHGRFKFKFKGKILVLYLEVITVDTSKRRKAGERETDRETEGKGDMFFLNHFFKTFFMQQTDLPQADQ